MIVVSTLNDAALVRLVLALEDLAKDQEVPDSRELLARATNELTGRNLSPDKVKALKVCQWRKAEAEADWERLPAACCPKPSWLSIPTATSDL